MSVSCPYNSIFLVVARRTSNLEVGQLQISNTTKAPKRLILRKISAKPFMEDRESPVICRGNKALSHKASVA